MMFTQHEIETLKELLYEEEEYVWVEYKATEQSKETLRSIIRKMEELNNENN